MIKNYELMVVITPKLTEEEATSMNDSVLALIKEQGGEIIKTDPWGKRMLAYAINKLNEGYYYVNYFKMESTSVKNVKRQINLSEKVIRHMFVVRED